MTDKTKIPVGRGDFQGVGVENKIEVSTPDYTPQPTKNQYARLIELEETLGRPRCRQIARKLKFGYPPARRNQSVLLTLMLEADVRGELQITKRGLKFTPAGRGKNV